MKWISVKDELPESGTDVLIAILTRPINAPAYYNPYIARYFNKQWFDSRGRSITAASHWKPILLPEIKYKNKPKDCDHYWYKNTNDRFCFDCGTIQKAIKQPEIYEGE